MFEDLVDTDILIWYLRGNPKAKERIRGLGNFAISSVTYMELLQGMRNREEVRRFKRTLHGWGIKTLFINEEISALAQYQVEKFCLSHALQLADALIASTALVYGIRLHTANDKHYRMIEDLEIEIFRPE